MDSKLEQNPCAPATETPAPPLCIEDLLAKHRRERKELQARITALRKAAAKGDKKKRNEVTDTVSKLETDLEQRHRIELGEVEGESGEPPIDTDNCTVSEALTNGGDENDERPVTRLSRAQKRRNKKLIEDSEREKRIIEQEEINKHGPRVIELHTISEILESSNLQLHNIPADGNCLYCAVKHQLEVTGRENVSVPRLRKLTASFMRQNKEEFLPFMYNEDVEHFNEDQFEKYCRDVEKTKVWGGQLELRALSNVLKCPIKIIQASGPSTVQGESFAGPPLTITYHRHLYRLGEHYNSTVELVRNDEM